MATETGSRPTLLLTTVQSTSLLQTASCVQAKTCKPQLFLAMPADSVLSRSQPTHIG